MTRARLRVIPVCLGVIAALALSTTHPAWAQESSSDQVYKDPTIVSDEETPEGVKDLGKAQDVKKSSPSYDTPPVYTKWWFWVVSAVAVGAVVSLAVLPLTPKARTCGSQGGVPDFSMGCLGDGRPKQ